MRMISKNKYSNLIILILILSIFSDILRVPNTQITFFRICLPLVICVIARYPKKIVVTSGVIIAFIVMSIIQHYLFYNITYTEYDFSLFLLIKSILLYISIILIFSLISVYKKECDNRWSNFVDILINCGKALLIIEALSLIFEKIIGISFNIDNPNNYACYFMAIIPLFAFKFFKTKRVQYVLWSVLLISMVYITDSKVALIGCFVEIFLIVCIMPDYKKINKMIVRIVTPLLVLFFVVLILVINPHIHEYALRDISLEPLLRIISSEPYSAYTSSISFRTNTTIYVIEVIAKTCIFGLGVGNCGVILKAQFPSLSSEYKYAFIDPTLSLHNSILEMISEIGVPIFVIIIAVFIYLIWLYCFKNELTDIEKIRIVFGLSFPIWIIGTSGMHTLYYIWIIIAFLFFTDKNSSLYGIRDNQNADY